MVGLKSRNDVWKVEIEHTPDNMRPREAASYTGISESTLAKLRMRENRVNGPRFVKLSGCVLYRRTDLDEWIDQNVIQAVE
jgi:predicted DNA-binding transcriptional regulator AlpA